VNDNWVVTTDQGAGGLDAGDTVDNSGAGDNGSLSGLIYGTNAFSTIADAQDAVGNGDTVHVVSGLYLDPATITKEITVEGDNAGVAGTAARANESVLGAGAGSLTIASDNVTIDGLTVRDATSGGGMGINVTSGSNITIAHNIITANSVGVVIDSGVGNFVVSDNLIASNNRSGSNRGQGVRVVSNSGSGSIVRNSFTGHNSGATTPGAVSLVDASNVAIGDATDGNAFSSNAVGIRISGTSSGIGIQNNNMTPPNTTDIIASSTGAGVISTLSGNTFGAATTYLDYSGSSSLDASGNTFGGVNPLGNSANLAEQYGIVDKITDGVDASGRGLVSIDPGHVYVTAASEAMNAGSISRGVALAPAGNTVHVQAGTYTDQILINKALSLIGDGATTVIDSPASLVTQFTTSGPNKPVIYATNSNAITIMNLTVDGLSQGNANTRMYGIAYYNAGGTIDGVTITNIRDNPFSGAQQGVGILAANDDAASRSLTVSNSNISNYQKNGIVFSGAGLSADATGNTVTGAGDTAVIAQNGIEYISGATGSITNNTISGHEYSGPGSGADPLVGVQSTGIILFNGGSGITVTGNTIDGNDIGIYNLASGTNITNNILGATSANRYEGIFVDQGSATITGNTITGGLMGVAVYAYAGASGDSTATISGGSITSDTGVQVFDDDLTGDAFIPVASVSGVDLTGTGAGYGVNVDGGKAMIQNSNLTGHLVGLHVAGNAIVDAGSDAGDSDPTGLGTSAGNNTISGYTGTGGSYAILNDNLVADSAPVVYARNNNFGALVNNLIVEGMIYDDTDSAAHTQVIFSTPQNLSSTAPSVVWVDDSWAGAGAGTDADGAGSNGTIFGYDQFATIQQAIDAVETNGVVNVAAGTYVENLVVNKAISLNGARQVDARNRFVSVPPADESVITAANSSSPALDITGGGIGMVISGLAFYGGGTQLQVDGGTLDFMRVQNNAFFNFTGSAVVLNVGGEDITFLQNSMDGSAQTGSDAVFAINSTAAVPGIVINNNYIKNGGANNTGLQLSGDHNVAPSTNLAPRVPQINSNNISGNHIGIDLGSQAFTGGVIQLNTISNNDLDGIQGGPQSSSIGGDPRLGNTFDSNGRYGLNLTSFGDSSATAGAQNNSILQNFFKLNGAADVFFDDAQAPGTISSNVLNQNSLVSPTAIIYNGGETIDVRRNWWGFRDGPSGAGRVGSGALITGTGAGLLDIHPWLTDGSDTGGNPSNGFQPNLTKLGHDAISISGVPSLNEGSTFTLTYNYNGDSDLASATGMIINWGDGTSTTVPGAIAASGTVTHKYLDGGPNDTFPNPFGATAVPAPIIQAFATLPGGVTYAMYPVATLSINNVAPTLAPVTNADSVNEAATYSLTIGNVVDPGTDLVSQYRINWGDLEQDTFTIGGTIVAGNTIRLTYTDVNNVQTSVSSTGKSGSSAVSQTVAALVSAWNSNLTLAGVATASANANSTAVLLTGLSKGVYFNVAGSVSGTGGSPTIARTTVGSLEIQTGAGLNAVGRVLKHVYRDDVPSGTSSDPFIITVDIHDEDNLAAPNDYYNGVYSKTITVNNVNPNPTISGPATTVTLAEGSNNTFSATAGDVSNATTEIFTYTWSVTKNGNPYASTTASGLSVANYVFTPNDEGTYVVSFAIQDDDASPIVNATARTYNVTNVAPAPTIVGTLPSEGSTATLTLNSGDVGGVSDVPYTYVWSITKNGSPYGTTNTVTASATSTPLVFSPDDNGTYVFSATVTDDTGTPGTLSQTVTIANVAPTATISGAPASVAEGSSSTLTASSTDPGLLDTVTYAWKATKGAVTLTGTGPTYAFAPTVFGTYTVTLSATDNFTGTPNTGTTTKVITVTNVGPTATIVGAPSTSGEGTSLTLTGATGDLGSGDTFTYKWNVTKDATPFASLTTTASNAFSFKPDDNAVYVVTLNVADSGGLNSDATAQTITVTNVAPSPAISGAPASSPEGTPLTMTGVAGDPGTLDTPFTYSWTVTKDGNAYASGTNSVVAFTPDDNAAYVVSLSVTDKDGATGATSTTVTVTDVAPTIGVSGEASLNEGSTYTLTLGGITDPAAANDPITTYKIIWGDGSDTDFIAGVPADGSTFTHRYDDGLATPTITVQLGDKDGLHDSGSKVITVNNVNPTGTFAGSATVNLGNSGSVIWTTHSDPSNDDNLNLVYDYDFNNDGVYDLVGSASPSATVPASYLNTAGNHVVKSQIRDNDGGSFVSTTTINVVDASLRVITFTPNNSGFSVQFNKSLVTGSLNLYDGDDLSIDAADMTVTAASNPGVALKGSLVYDASTNTAMWVYTGGVMPNDTYTVTLVSGANAFTHGGGDDLDGNTGTPGLENYSQNFVINGSSRVVSLPDFTRGAGQNAKMPFDTSAGLPITLSNPQNVTSVDFDLFYNHNLLSITAVDLAAGVPGGWTITPSFTVISPTLTRLRVTLSGAAPLSAGTSPMSIVSLTANVPAAAPYGDSQVLRVENVVVDAVNSRGDYAIQKAAYVGDTNRNGAYTGLDKSLMDRVIAGIDTGFDSYQLIDPVVIADVDGNGLLQGNDSAWLAQKSVAPGMRPEIPNIPGIVLIPGAGPDPTIDIPDNLHVTAGGFVDVPLDITDSAAGLKGFTVNVNYDPAKLSLSSGFNSADITLGSLFTGATGWSMTTNVDQSTGTATLFFSRLYEMLDDHGTFANLHFAVAGDLNGAATITPSGLASDGGLSFTYKAGSVTTDFLEFHYTDAGQPQSIKATGNYTAADLVLTNQTTSTVVPVANVSASYNAGTNVTTFTFPGYANGTLPDGNYQAVIGGSKVLDFFFLNGDANHDRVVNINDLSILSQNYGQSGKVFSQGDFDYDGNVDAADLGILSTRWQQSLTAPAGSPVSATTGATTGTVAKRTPFRKPLTDLTK
jgi:hypothetical protein